MEDLSKESPITTSKIIKEKEAEGWIFAGSEGLKRVKFQPDSKFIAEAYQTTQQIIQKTLDKFRRQASEKGQESDFEVELVPQPPEIFQGQPVVNKLQDTEEQLIFVRVKK